ncbi:MAG: MetQ/NlpA family ABC transporter substrate-binding protein [Tissierellia bacterium]|nr:MetQ/NlpA family ABC transporter substrate-binding protein [Tissierellia bacterium]
MKKRVVLLSLFLVLSLLVVGCGKGNNGNNGNNEGANDNAQVEGVAPEATADGSGESLEEDNKIVLGVSPVPHEEIVEALKDKFTEAGLEVEVVAFDDYVQPNVALDEGDLDANYFQHKPYLDSFSAERNLKLTSIGPVHIEPMGFYSDKIKSIDELQEGDEILIPNDPSNGARALLLLEKNGLITLKDSEDQNVTEADIETNEKNLKFTPLEAATIPNAYKDVAGAVINSNFALGAGLTPGKDSLIIEDKESPYANIVAVRTGEETKEKFKVLMDILQSEDCKNFIEEKYEGSIHPTF